jgi:TetR/AcrR family transcriptional regulator, regulator of biofilm formation and stress response
LPGSQRAYRSS